MIMRPPGRCLAPAWGSSRRPEICGGTWPFGDARRGWPSLWRCRCCALNTGHPPLFPAGLLHEDLGTAIGGDGHPIETCHGCGVAVAVLRGGPRSPASSRVEALHS